MAVVYTQQVDQLMKKYTFKHTFENMKAILVEIHKTHINAAGLVLALGVEMMLNHSKRIFDPENHLLLEQIFYASLQLKAFDWSFNILKFFQKTYGKTSKVYMLQAYYEVAANDFEDGMRIFMAIIDCIPGDPVTIKRLIALYRNNGIINQCVTMLNQYLETNQADLEAWQELADIYLSKQLFEKAKFCFEEMVCMYPNNYAIIVKFAELLYSEGSFVNARKYFCHVITLNKSSPRAFLGLYQTTLAIESSGGNKTEAKKNVQIRNIAYEGLKKIYSKSAIKLDWFIERLKEKLE